MRIHTEPLRLCLVPLALWASACGSDPEPCFGLRQSEPLELRVVSEYSEAAGYEFGLDFQVTPAPCPAALRLAAPRTLQLAVTGHQERSGLACLLNTADVLSGSGLALGEPALAVAFGTEDDAEIVHAAHALTVDGCPGRWALSVETRASYGRHGDPFLPAPASGYPPIVMHTGFELDDRGSAACSRLLPEGLGCNDYYVVELSRP